MMTHKNMSLTQLSNFILFLFLFYLPFQRGEIWWAQHTLPSICVWPDIAGPTTFCQVFLSGQTSLIIPLRQGLTNENFKTVAFITHMYS